MRTKVPSKKSSQSSGGRWRTRHHLEPGDLDRIAHLHGVLYARECGFDETFEKYVADGLNEFVKSSAPQRNRIWVAEVGGQTAGTIAIVGCSASEAQLRWFLVHPDFRGAGLGRQLMRRALGFCRGQGYATVFLWTTSKLDVARHIYTRFGFKKTEEKTHAIWGKMVTEERYDLRLEMSGRDNRD